mgnify:CR=1 FL=1
MGIIEEIRAAQSLPQENIAIGHEMEVHIPKHMKMPVNTFIGIMNNKMIFGYMANFNKPTKEFVFYYDYREVSTDFKLGNVLIYLPTLHLYQLFEDVDKYSEYINRMREFDFTEEIFARQLVLISAAHNFIVKCENSKTLIKRIVEVIHKKPIRKQVDGYWIQLTFDIIFSNFLQERDFFEEISRKVRNESFTLPVHGEENKFIENNTASLHVKDKEKITKRLKHIEKYIMQAKKVQTYNHCAIGAVDSNCKNATISAKSINKSSDNKSAVRNWIRVNPISGMISQKEYRKKFFDDTGIDINANTWGKHASGLVERCGSQHAYYKMAK